MTLLLPLEINRFVECRHVEMSFSWVLVRFSCSLSLWPDRLVSNLEIVCFHNSLFDFTLSWTFYHDITAVFPSSGFCHWNPVIKSDLVFVLIFVFSHLLQDHFLLRFINCMLVHKLLPLFYKAGMCMFIRD